MSNVLTMITRLEDVVNNDRIEAEVAALEAHIAQQQEYNSLLLSLEENSSSYITLAKKYILDKHPELLQPIIEGYVEALPENSLEALIKMWTHMRGKAGVAFATKAFAKLCSTRYWQPINGFISAMLPSTAGAGVPLPHQITFVGNMLVVLAKLGYCELLEPKGDKGWRVRGLKDEHLPVGYVQAIAQQTSLVPHLEMPTGPAQMCGRKVVSNKLPKSERALHALRVPKYEYTPNAITLLDSNTESGRRKIAFNNECDEVMQKFLDGKPFHFDWKFDEVGRVYCQGYHANIQGEDHRKATLSFAEKRVLTERGFRALELSIANAAGFDRKTETYRLKWVRRNERKFYQCEDLTTPNTAYVNLLVNIMDEEPHQFHRLVCEWVKAKRGEPVSPMAFKDAVASGPQILAAATGDIKTAIATNLIPDPNGDKRHCPYGDQADKTGLERAVLKAAMMPHFYGSIKEVMKVFPDKAVRDEFYRTLKAEYPGPSQYLKEVLKLHVPKLYDQWTMPDGHVVRVHQLRKVEVTADIPLLNMVGPYAYTQQFYKNLPKERSVALAARIVHSIDAYVCREVIRRCYEHYGVHVAPVHDCFFVHPNDMWLVDKTYLEILTEIHKSDLLGDIFSQITGKNIQWVKMADFADLIPQATYAIT